ncbi:Uncharacterized protein TCAP_07497 [Tolypocladium capitatum]|uniref:Copper acquisition factor BIM1-like domain-containing protein n=1 Tax=Tolypocladium capitatum TaxID=45235 RepID=A0A2K3PU76_9HYPO|nr:Uncharacterized protein TCAP_07497 [Tolypocladium capitatum]
MKSLLLPPLALAGLAAAHFQLLYPKSIGFADDNEGTAPCGGFTPDFSKDVVDFHIGGEALAMLLVHPQGNWLFRVTADQKAQTGWEQIFPIVMQGGLGNFCEPRVTVPDSYVGKKGVVGVVSDTADGLLYQCVTVNFVAGSADPPSVCKNGTVKASFADDAKLSALVGTGGSAPSSPASSPTSSAPSAGTQTTTAAPKATSTGAAATLKAAWSPSGLGWGNAVTVLSMVVLGAAFVI